MSCLAISCGHLQTHSLLSFLHLSQVRMHTVYAFADEILKVQLKSHIACRLVLPQAVSAVIN